ncbi:hypothetical protein ILYODFUR_017145 [Ilyodon furcidens]|uniref:Uncharacterized protein n=1 Tax=Ilyodon furcidens TaxID=33524 RepID=A0ABV0U769_9TELE
MRETERAYCISPEDMKGTVITGLVLSLINLVLQTDEKQRIETAGKNPQHMTPWKPGGFIRLREAVVYCYAIIAFSIVTVLTSTIKTYASSKRTLVWLILNTIIS